MTYEMRKTGTILGSPIGRTEIGIAPMQRELLEEDEGEEACINSKNMPYK